MRARLVALPLAFACALSAATLAPNVARAQATPTAPAADAKQAFDEAVETEKRGEYEKALERFKKVEAVKATPGVLFHEGYCLEMLGRLVPAFVTYERAEEMARAQKKQEVVTAVQSRLVPLSQRVPLINVTAEPKEAEIRVDGQIVTNMSVRVDAGDHDVVASAPGYTTKKLRLSIRDGQVQSVALLLERGRDTPATTPTTAPVKPVKSETTPPPASPVTEPPGEEPRRKSIALPIAATAGAVVFLGGGIVSFLLAGSAQSDAEKTCPTKLSCSDEQIKVRTFDAVALGGFVGGLGLGALAVILWTGRSSGSASAKLTTSGSMLFLQGEL